MNLSHLTLLVTRYQIEQAHESECLPNLSVYSRDALSEIEAMIYEPVVCLILQGSKVTTAGDQRAEVHPGDALLVSHDLPVMSRITQASKQTPYIALLLSLDLTIIRSLYDQIADAPLQEGGARSLAAWRADPAWLDPLTRYLELMNNPMDARVLGPAILREIHYRLLLSPIGQMLRCLLIADSHASRIAKAIHTLRTRFRSPLSVAELARTAGMSASSFHEHFKSVTGTTPLRYQKDLRMIEARALLVERQHSVSETAFTVGYESPTQFSRDYSKKFGVPPSRARGDAARTAHLALH